MSALQAVEMVGKLGSPGSVGTAEVNPNNSHAPERGTASQPPSNLAGTSPQLISRPSAPAYVRIASGTLSGTIIPLQVEDVVIGEGENCNVRLSANDYEKIRGREASISLGAGGWKITETKRPEGCSETIFVGGQPCRTTLPVRSGDIICLSNTGPDLQFVIQGESTWTWQDVADELDLAGSSDSKAPAKPNPRPMPPAGSDTARRVQSGQSETGNAAKG